MAKQKGKYAHITPYLKKLDGVSGEANADAKYQDKVEAAKAAMLAPPVDGDPIDTPDGVRFHLGVTDAEMKMAIALLMRRCAGRRHGIKLAHAYAQARDLKDQIKGWLEEANLLVEAYGQLTVDQLECEGSGGVDIGGRSLSYHVEPWTKAVDNTAVTNFFWADPALRTSLRPMWQTLDALNRKRLLNGEEPVPGTEVFAKTKIRLGGE